MARSLRSWWRRWVDRFTPALRHRPRRSPGRQRPFLEVLEDRYLLSSVIVNTTADDPNGSVPGQTTLRDAINAVNAGQATEIDFQIGAAGGAQTISLSSALPAITANDVCINGLSQGGSGKTTPLIELNGVSAGSGIDGLLLQGSNCTVSGLIIEGFSASSSHTAGAGIEVANSNEVIGGVKAGNVLSGNYRGLLIDSGCSGVLVEGNDIGTDASGSTAVGNSEVGIDCFGTNSTIGGTAAGAGNLISGNSVAGIGLVASASAVQVLGNSIGTNAGGSSALANGTGVEVAGVQSTVGGSSGAARNIISGNTGNGVVIDDTATSTVVQNNYIGTNNRATQAVANGGYGVTTASTNTNITRNTIADNKRGGVEVSAGSRNLIRHNSIYANGSAGAGPGIFLVAGTNGNLAPPIINTATLNNGVLTVTGTFDALISNMYYNLDFFVSPTGDPEGKTFVGTLNVKSSTSGTQNFTFTVTTPAANGTTLITATVTDGNNNTSAFSNGVLS